MTTDYVVIGAGSAGCVVAARLSEAGYSVCLLEAGKKDTHPMIHIPAGIGHLIYNESVNWMYEAEPEPGTGNRTFHTPRGKVLGGSHSINGMLHVRGNPADYNAWAALGCKGWSWEEVLPLFKRSENYLNDGDPNYRGTNGPMPVQHYNTVLPITNTFVQAAEEAGFAFTPDLNGSQQEGVSHSQMTRKGRFRGSTYRTFIANRSIGNKVNVVVESLVDSLTIENGVCVGVRYQRRGKLYEVRPRREIILSAGAIGSPQILQLSGIGDQEKLASIGVTPVINLPGVGQNLSDHYAVRLSCRLKKGITTINELATGWRVVREALKYALFGSGALTFGVTTALVFCKSKDELECPDIQLSFTPASYAIEKALVGFEKQPGMTVGVCPTRPSSRGSVTLKTSNPKEQPAIRFGYMDAPDDMRLLSIGIEFTRKIFGAPAFEPYVVAETVPGEDIQSYEQLEKFVREQGSSLYHPVGTCKMGIDDTAVTTPDLKVRGIENLRVADASIMPFLTTGNTNAPTIMIGEKAADLIIANASNYN